MIYAVHQGTKAHRRIESVNGPISAYEAVVKADADGWIEWNGETSCRPIADDQCYEAKTRDGRVVKKVSRWLDCNQLGQKLDSDITHYRPIIDQPASEEPNGWDGEGLPPVGIECEIQRGEGLNWYKITVRAYSPNKHYIWISDDGGEGEVLSLQGSRYKFRPLRTDREQWVDRALCLITPAPSPKMLAEAIYDALAIGELPLPEKTK